MAWSASARAAALAARRRFHARMGTNRLVGPVTPKQARFAAKLRKEGAKALKASRLKGGLWKEIYGGATFKLGQKR